jgi:hypothetical protein
MPKAAPYLLHGLLLSRSYVLTQRANSLILDITPESPAWFAWLVTPSPFFGTCCIGSKRHLRRGQITQRKIDLRAYLSMWSKQ